MCLELRRKALKLSSKIILEKKNEDGRGERNKLNVEEKERKKKMQ